MNQQLRSRVDEAIRNFALATQDLKRAVSRDTAEEACMTCRDAVQLFFFSRDEYREEASENVELLLASLDEAENALREFADDVVFDSYVGQYLESVQRRKHLVSAVMNDDVARVKVILQEGLESAGATP